MYRSLLCIALFVALGSPAFPAGALAAPGNSTVCLPSGDLKELVRALDDAVSGSPDRDRTCLRSLLLPEARLSPVLKADTGGFAPHVLTVDAWIDAVKKSRNKPFYERQVKVSSDTYGHIAHLWSTYEVRPTPLGKPEIRGINSIHAVYDGKRWRILEILWQAETAEEKVPKRYLP
jgi:hypothetical protein